MDSTSNRTPIDLTSPDNEVTFEGWTLLESVIYDLWLSPCKTYLVQHYVLQHPEDQRYMRHAYIQDLNLQDFRLRQVNRMGQIIGTKGWDYQIIHEFTGCHWYGNEDFPEDFVELRKDIHRAEVSWPTIRPGNLYRNPEGELRVIGPCTAFEDAGQPYDLNYWATIMTPEEFKQAQQYQEGGRIDTRVWEVGRLGPL